MLIRKTLTIFICLLSITGASILLNTNVKAAASFIILGPSTINTGQNVTITISANRDAAYNAVDLNVTFTEFTYVGTSVGPGWTAVSGPSVAGNTISFAGALLGSSASGSKPVLTINLRAPNKATTGSITVSGKIDGTGLGAGSENGSGSRFFNIIRPQPTPTATPTPTPKPLPNAVEVSSTTHTNPDQWYQSNTVILNWKKDVDVVGFSYLLDASPDTIPGEEINGTIDTITYDQVPDGINYFHIRAKNSVGWGPTTHFAIRIDSTPPNPFTPTLIQKEDGTYKLYFSTHDNTESKLKYYVIVDGQELGEQNSEVTIPNNAKEIIIQAKDQAGNIVTSTYKVKKDQNNPTLTPTASDTNQNKDDNKNSLNIALLVALVLTIIYGIIITIVYFNDKRKILKNNTLSLDNTMRSSQENLPTFDLKISKQSNE
jgi:hypothetical protein